VPTFYLDTSALIKRYIQERGTVWIQQLTDPAVGHLFFTVRLTGPEMIAAIYRRVNVGASTLADAQRAATTFRLDWQHEYQIVEVSASTASSAMSLAERHLLRGYDAVHLAAALEVQGLQRATGQPPLTFVSADLAQLRAAMAEGLPVDDPNNYP
jgi:predicted nucleic acid-binding protein